MCKQLIPSLGSDNTPIGLDKVSEVSHQGELKPITQKKKGEEGSEWKWVCSQSLRADPFSLFSCLGSSNAVASLIAVWRNCFLYFCHGILRRLVISISQQPSPLLPLRNLTFQPQWVNEEKKTSGSIKKTHFPSSLGQASLNFVIKLPFPGGGSNILPCSFVHEHEDENKPATYIEESKEIPKCFSSDLYLLLQWSSGLGLHLWHLRMKMKDEVVES